MKRIGSWLRGAACALVMLGALAFGAIAVWQLVSGDWRLFENASPALLQVLLKLLLCLYCFGIGLGGALRKAPCFWPGLRLLAVTLGAAPFLSNHLGLLPVLFAVLFLISERWALPGAEPGL